MTDTESAAAPAEAEATTPATTEPAAAADTGAVAQPTAATPVAASWRDQISDPKLAKFVDGYTTPSDLAQAALGWRQKLSDRVWVPDDGASDEDKAKFRRAMGVPDSADGYTVEAPEDLPEPIKAALATEETKTEMAEFLGQLHAANATPAIVQAVMGKYYDMVAKGHSAREQASQAAEEAASVAIQKEWGADHDANLNAANLAVRQFGGGMVQVDDGQGGQRETPELLALMQRATVDGVRFDRHPAFLRTFAQIGRRMGEHGSQMTMDQTAAASMAEQLADLAAKTMDAQARGDRVAAERHHRQAQDISQRLYGSGPIVGADGRAV